MNTNLAQALALQTAAQAAQNVAASIADYQAVVAQWVSCGQAASSAGNDAAATADAAETITISPSLQEIADANHQLGNYSTSIQGASVTLQLARELAAESGTEAGYAIAGATAALNAGQDVAGGVGPASAPVVAPTASSVAGVVVGIGIFGTLTWLAFRAIIPPLR